MLLQPRGGHGQTDELQDGEVVRRQAEWEREIETLDAKEMELHQSQLRLMREQMATFIRDLAVLQMEVANLKNGHTERLDVIERAFGDSVGRHSKELEVAHGKLDQLSRNVAGHHGSLQERESRHAALQDRVDQLEKKSAGELEATRVAHAKLTSETRAREAHHASIAERLDYLEQALGDSVERHAKELRATHAGLDQLHSRLTACEAHGPTLDNLAKVHADLANDQANSAAHHATVAERLELLEKTVGDSAERHAKELKAAHCKLDQLHSHLGDHQGSLQDRESQHASLQDRVDYLEQSLGESINRHARELESTKAAQGKMQKDAQAREGHHACVVQRLESLEAALGDTTGRHSEEQDATRRKLEEVHSKLGEHHAQLVHHASLQERVRYLEKLLGDNADRHAQGLEEARAQLDQLHGRLSACEAQNSSIEGLKKAHTGLTSDKAKRDAQHASMAERLEYLEKVLGESADGHARQLAAAYTKIDEIHGRLSACERNGGLLGELQKAHMGLANEKAMLDNHHATLKERVEYLEHVIDDSAERHAKELDTVKAAHNKLTSEAKARDAHHASVADRLSGLERLLGDTSERHAEDLSLAHAKLDQMHGRLTVCESSGAAIDTLKKAHSALANDKAARDAHHATLAERLGYLEQVLGDSADRHAQELKAAHGRLDQLQARLSEERSAREAHSSTMHDQLTKHKDAQEAHQSSVQERLSYLEALLGESADKHSRDLEAAKAAQAKLTSETKAREAHHASIAERLDFLESKWGDAADRHSRELAAAHTKLEQLHSRVCEDRAAQEAHLRSLVASDKDTRDAHHATLKERIDYLEGALGESAEKAARELESVKLAHSKLTKDTKAREAHHASIAERLDYLEKQVGDSVNRHGRELQEASNKLELMHGRLSSCEKNADSVGSQTKVKELERRHASMKERVDYLESMLGDSADRHARELDALKAAHSKAQNEAKARDAHHASVSERLGYVEKLLGDSADKHAMDQKAAHAKIDQLHGRLLACEELGNTVNQHARDLTAAHSRLEQLQGRLADDREAQESRLRSLMSNEKDARDAHHASVKERLDYLEACAESAEKAARELQSIKLELAHSNLAEARSSHHALTERLDYLEKLVGDSVDKHARELQEASNKIEQMHGRLQTCEKHGAMFRDASAQAKMKELDRHHATIKERVDYIESSLGDSADRHARELEALKVVQAKAQNEAKARDAHHASVDERLTYVEKLVGDSVDQHVQELKAAHSKLEQLHGRFAVVDDLGAVVDGLRKSHTSIVNDRAARDAHHASMAERLDYVERLLGDSAERHSRELSAANARLEQVHGLLAEERSSREAQHALLDGAFAKEREGRNAHHASFQERLKYIEGILGESADRLGEVRQQLGQEAQLRTQHFESVAEHLASEKRARESHEKAVQNHLSNERKAREVHEGLVQDMFGHERSTRERHHAHLLDQLTREREGRDKHLEAHQEQLNRHRGQIDSTLKDVIDMVHKEKASREQLHASHQDSLQRDRATRTAIEDYFAQEKAERSRHYESINERSDSLQRTVNIFDSLIRKEMEERSKENRRIWDAIDNHTHDLSTQVISEGGNRKEVPELTTEVPQRLTRSASATPPTFTVHSPTGSALLQQQQPPVMESVVRMQPAVPPAAVRVHSPMNAASYRNVVAAPTAVPVASSTTSVQMRHMGPPSPRRSTESLEHHIERVTCGHTRYFGERHRAAEILVD